MELMTIPFTKPFLELHPELSQLDIADSSIIVETQANGGPTPAVARRMYSYLLAAVDAGADCVLVTCTSVNSITKQLRGMLSIPVVSIEEPVAAEAVAAGSRIGILSSVATSARPVRDTILEMAAAAGREVEVSSVVADGAFEALMSGDRELHDDKIRQALAKLVTEVDVVVFAQLSMALVKHQEYDVPILKLGLSGYEAAYQAMKIREEQS
jgi:Asp/Glu/hydantoin racemase